MRTLSEKERSDLWPALFNFFTRTLGTLAVLTAFGGFALVVMGKASPWYLLVGLVSYIWFGFMGLTIGLHRYFCHRSFKTNKFWHYAMAITATLCSNGSVIAWVGLHRHHHLHTDTDDDAHDPRRIGIWRAFLYLYKRVVISEKYVRPELRDPVLIFLHIFYFPVILAYIGILGIINPMLIIWCYAVPVLGVYIGLSAVTTVAHLHGYKTYDINDESRNSWLASLLSGGEGWHNNHHAYPSYHRQGHLKWELDPAAWVIEHIIGTEVRKIDFTARKKAMKTSGKSAA